MRGTTHSVVARELHDVITQHFERLVELNVVSGDFAVSVPEDVVKGVEFLSSFCSVMPPAPVAHNVYDEVQNCLDNVTHFLALINYNADRGFESRELNKILGQAQKWCRAAAAQNAEASLSGVWELIDPVRPDSLYSVGDGSFDAMWWKPIPWMDVEILRRTEGVIIQDESVNPDKLPGGIVVRFKIAPAYERGFDRGA
jgi:hypothetical protein